jgi:ParB-like chromosome segregation protein Spo0J
MIEHLHVTQAEFGKRMGLSQSLVANRLRMLKLPEAIRHNWITGELTQWHAIKLLEWQNKFNLTLPHMAFLTLAFKKKLIIPSYLDDGLFEEKIASLPGGRDLLQNNPLPVQANMLEEIEEEPARRKRLP